MIASLCAPYTSIAASKSASATFGAETATTTNMSVSMGNGRVNLVTENGKKAWRLEHGDTAKENAISYITCDIDDAVMNKLPTTAKVRIDVEYYDRDEVITTTNSKGEISISHKYGGFAVIYDGQNGKNGSVYQPLYGTNTWKTATFYITDAYFDNDSDKDNDPHNAKINKVGDFSITANDRMLTTVYGRAMGISESDVLISSVKVELCAELAPFDITVGTDRPGNIFYEGDSLDFGINYADPTGKYKNAMATYTVKDLDGNTVQTKKTPFSNNFYSLALEPLPFGVYTLDIVAEDTSANIRQRKVVDFSYSKKAKTVNPLVGTNTHFDWTVYDREDIRTIADLAKNAGYSMTRSSIRWYQIEQTKGNYALTDNIEYSNKYIDSIGLEMLGILTLESNYAVDGVKVGVNHQEVTTDAQRKAYADFCEWTVGALKGYTDYWSYPNEYNLGDGGKHTPGREVSYMNLINRAYSSIVRANPNAVIVNGEVGSYWIENRNYIDYCLDRGALDRSDIFSLHVYDQYGGPETWYIYGSMQAFNDKIAAKDSSKRAWITEVGWPSTDTNGNDTFHKMKSYEKQAAFYSRSMAINADPDRIDKTIYYSLIDNNEGHFDAEDNFGIVESHDYRTPFAAKPAYLTVAAYNALLDGYTYSGDYNGDHSSLMNNGWDHDKNTDVPNNYTDAKFMRSFKNSDGDEIVMAWKSEYIENEETYTYSSDKKYFEIYDMYGNKEVVANTTGSYTAKYTNNPVYIHATDLAGGIVSENVDTAWRIGSVGDVNVRVSLPESVKSGTAINIVAAAYDKNGGLIGTQVKFGTYGGKEITVSFDGASMKNCASVKIFALDGFDKLTPLVENGVIPEFGDDSSVEYQKSGGRITVSGILPTGKAKTDVLVTVFSAGTHRADLETENGFENSVLYQDMVESDIDGKYALTFKLPEGYTGDCVKVHIGAKNSVLQKIIYLK